MNHKVNIFELFRYPSVLRLLGYFAEHPTGAFYLGELPKKTGLSKVSALHALDRLKKAGFLRPEQVGRMILYRLNRSDPRVKEFKRLLNIFKATRLCHPLQGMKGEVYLYGSAARGENDEKSDWDILILSDRLEEVKSRLAKIRDEKIKPLLFSSLEYAALYRKDKPLYERLEKDKVRLV